MITAVGDDGESTVDGNYTPGNPNPPTPPSPPTPPTPTEPSEPTEDAGSGGGGENQNQNQQTGPTETQPVEEVVRPYTIEFKPKVGMLISINNSKDLRYLGSAYYSSTDRANDTLKKYSDESDSFGDALDKRPATTEGSKIRDTLEIFGGTAWLPMIEDLPDLTASLGRTYKYAVLCDDWFNASKFKTDTYSDPVYGEDDMYIKEVTSETDNTEATVERSWDNRDPGEIKEGVKGEEGSDSDSSSDSSNSSESGDSESSDDANTVEKNPGFYTETELEQFSPVLDPPSWLKGDSQYIPYNYFTSFFLKDGTYSNYTGKAGGTTTYAFDDLLYTPYIGNTWYYNTEVQKVRQDSFNPHNVVLGSATTDEMILRALEILGDDILLRDEYVISNVYNSYKDIFDIGDVHTYPDVDENASSKEAKFFGYFYSNTSVMDTHEPLVQPSNSSVYGNDSLVTNDYIIQCIYRAMGVNCLKTQVFFYADKEMDIDFTPIASELTVDVKNVNQIQNRVDVFNTRTNLDQYWAKAVSDGLIKETGVLTYNTLDAAYKPWAVCMGESGPDAEDIVMKDPNDTACTVKYPAGTWFELNPYGKDLSITEAGKRGHSSNVEIDEVDYKLIDYARTEHMTLAEFCIVLKKAMDIYGEEILTEKEQTLLLLNYGTSLPYELPEEELIAVKYLMAKGIVEERMRWSEELQLDDMLIILARVADPATRLTFKEITITYDQALLDAGYYPAQVQMNSVGDSPVNVISSVPMLGDNNNLVNGGYANAEYIDYFLNMSSFNLSGDVVNPDTNEVEAVSKEVTPYFKYDAESRNVEDLSSLYIAMCKPSEGGSVDNTVASNFLQSNGPKDLDSIKVMGVEYLSDGHAYMHIRVRGDCIYTRDSTGHRNLSSYNKDYVLLENGKPYIIINSTVTAYAPQYWKIRVDGGIYRTNAASFATDPDNPEIRYISKYVFTWDTDYYEGDYSAGVAEAPYRASSHESGIDITDLDAMKREGIYPSTIMDMENGKVTTAAIPEITLNSSRVISFDSFDTVSAGGQYVDRQRMLVGYASYLTANPYLEGEDEAGPLGIRQQVSEEHMTIFSVKCVVNDTTDADFSVSRIQLVGDLYYGDIKVVSKDAYEEIAPEVPNLKCQGYNPSTHTVLYYFEGVTDDKLSGSQLYVKGIEDGVQTISAYVKTNDEMLVDVEALELLLNTTSNGQYLFEDFSTYIIEEDESGNPSTLMLSFSLAGTDKDTIPYNVFLYKGMNLVSVNNMITAVPSGSILFVEKDDGGFLINYRAVLGWQSGFTWNTTSGEGTLFLTKETRSIDDIYNIVNGYSGVEESIPVHTIAVDGGTYYTVPLSSAYTLANFVLYTTVDNGVHLFILKNNDNICTDSVINNIAAEVPEGADDAYKDVKSIYQGSGELFSKYLGVSVGNADFESSVLIAHYDLTDRAQINLTEEVDKSAIAISEDFMKEAYTEENLGKVYRDSMLGCWFYIVPTISSHAVKLWDTSTVDSLTCATEAAEFIQDREDYHVIGDAFRATLRPAVVGYYSCTYPFPWFKVKKASATHVGNMIDNYKFIDISCNTYEGFDYGTMLAGAYTPTSVVDADLPYGYYFYSGGNYDGNWSRAHTPLPITALVNAGGYAVNNYDIGGNVKTGYGHLLSTTTHYDCPLGFVQVIMGINGVTSSSLHSDKNVATVYTGNIRRLYNKGTSTLTDYCGRGSEAENMNTPVPEDTVFGLLNSTITDENYVYSSFTINYTDDRKLLLDDNVRGSLEDRVQTPIIDWSEFTFNRLLHDVDNFASIFLIIVLNILPRICMFVFIIMIGLATVANVKPWRRFCTNVFDPYKFFTFGHATVLTIDTKLLLISSIIATATFALFMDGTLLHLISWFVQFVSAFITR